MSANKPLVTQAYVFAEKGAKGILQDITLPALGALDVEVQMSHCGLCHTDIHMRDNDWGITDYPLVPGHEGVGVITQIGSGVTTREVGQKVAIGWMRNSCQACEFCTAGRENNCLKGYQGLFLGPSAGGVWGQMEPEAHKYGGCFSKVMRIHHKFVYVIPETLPIEMACPLICGGGTVFEPIVDYVNIGTKVGVVGIGGLGTAAVKLAKLAGGVVTAISGTESKRSKMGSVGASSFVLSSSEKEMKQAAGTLDLILDTTPTNSEVNKWMALLKFGGTYVRLGIPKASDQEFTTGWIPLIFTNKKINGSVVTGSARMERMLDLVDRNQEFMKDPENWSTQEMPFSQVNEAMEQLVTQTNKGWRIMLKW